MSEHNFRKSLSESRILSPKNSYLPISAIYAAAVCSYIGDQSIAPSGRRLQRTIAHKSETNRRTAYRCLAYFSAISVSVCTKLARSILMRDRNIVTEPDFRKSLSKSRILSPKNSCQFRLFKQQRLLLADGLIAMTSRPVCLSVCLSVSKITKKHLHGFG